MEMRVVGAGLPRTGTLSLKAALERLLGGPCYHMSELFAHPEHAATWADAAEGQPVDWPEFLDGYAASVDVPAAMLWRELSAAFPDAVVLLSTRESPGQWWDSMDKTIFPRVREREEAVRGEGPVGGPPEMRDVMRMFGALTGGFAAYADNRDGGMAWYERYNAEVRAAVPAGRLVEWRAVDGWGPLCAALGVPVPDEPFPRVNSSEEFQASFGAMSPEEMFTRRGE